MTRSLKRQSGLTLVELMVATVLSLVLLSGVLLVFSANKATYRTQVGLGALQENGRYALRQISDDLRMSGYSGCLSNAAENGLSAIMVASSPPEYVSKFAGGEFVEGINDQAGTQEYDDIAMLAGTDAIEIRGLMNGVNYTAGDVAKLGDIVVLGGAAGIAVDDYLMISDCQNNDVFRATAVVRSEDDNETTISHAAGKNEVANLSEVFNVESIVGEVATRTYFVANTGRNNTRGRPITALYRFDGTNAVELVEGVEDLQVQYGEDTDVEPDFVADTFNDASDVGDWGRVMSVRLLLLVNSVEAASDKEETFVFSPRGNDRIAPADGDFRIRQEFAGTYSLRNSVF